MERIAKLFGMILLLAAGCGQPADLLSGAAAAEAPAEGVSGLPLERVLAALESQLDSALAEGLGAASARRLSAAEGVTDRLLETELPFAWLGDGGYSVEARLRQIQALADRVVAQAGSGAGRDSLADGVEAFRDAVGRLREELGRGGGPAPARVEDLLRAMDTLRREAPG